MTYTRFEQQTLLQMLLITTNGSAVVTITFSSDHNLQAGDIILLDNFSTITNSNFGASDFNDNKFMVTSVSSSTSITITMSTTEGGSGGSASGGIRVQSYYRVGPAGQLPGFGWSLGQWGGTVSGEATNKFEWRYQCFNNNYCINRCNIISFFRNKFYSNRK